MNIFTSPVPKRVVNPDGQYMFDVYLKVEFLHLAHSSTKYIRFLPFTPGADDILLSQIRSKEAYKLT